MEMSRKRCFIPTTMMEKLNPNVHSSSLMSGCHRKLLVSQLLTPQTTNEKRQLHRQGIRQLFLISERQYIHTTKYYTTGIQTKPFFNNITHLAGDPDFLSGRRAPFVGE